MQRSFLGARWQLAAAAADHIDAAQRRGIRHPAAARAAALRRTPDDPSWAPPSLEHLHDPHQMRGMDAALDRLRRAARDGEHLRVITDYDVDGTTSSLILGATLRMFSPHTRIDQRIPDRFTEGYGFSEVAAERAIADGVQLIVTADVGVRDHAAIAKARNGGVEVLVCDHHLPDGASVPDDALVLCPPQAGCGYPNKALAACGVTTKLAQALLAKDPRLPRVLPSLLKLAAIGTVADMVSLATPENRAIVTLGLRALNQGPHTAGLTALLDVAGLTAGQISAGDLGFRIGPRINAAGRIAHARHVIDLLGCRDATLARELAAELDALNRERQQLQQRLAAAAQAAVPSPTPSFVVVSGPEEDGWHRGVVGIVAARLKDAFHRPAAVVSIQGDQAVGSVRSVPGVHAVDALSSASHLLHRFGGHPAAAGFSLPASALPELAARLSAWVDANTPGDALDRTTRIDAEADAATLSAALHAELSALGPFGMGNPVPRLLIPNVRVRGVRTMGREASHLSFRVPTPQGDVRAVWWKQAAFASDLQRGPVDLCATLEENTWNGRTTLQLNVVDAREAR